MKKTQRKINGKFGYNFLILKHKHLWSFYLDFTIFVCFLVELKRMPSIHLLSCTKLKRCVQETWSGIFILFPMFSSFLFYSLNTHFDTSEFTTYNHWIKHYGKRQLLVTHLVSGQRLTMFREKVIFIL